MLVSRIDVFTWLSFSTSFLVTLRSTLLTTPPTSQRILVGFSSWRQRLCSSRYLADLQTFLECIKFVRSLANMKPFSDMVVGEANPGPNVTTDEQLEDWLKKYMATTYHSSGTCSMLPREKNGVVDPELVVYGTSNIRVCDLSILPLQFAAHPQGKLFAFLPPDHAEICHPATIYSFAARGEYLSDHACVKSLTISRCSRRHYHGQDLERIGRRDDIEDVQYTFGSHGL